MKYELKPDNRNSSDEELISDLIKVSRNLDKKDVTQKEYNKHGRFSGSTLKKRFGCWSNALTKAGLSTKVTKSDLIMELKRVAGLPCVDVLSKTVFEKYKKISSANNIEYTFGSWNNALKAANINIHPSQRRYSNDDLFNNLLDVWTHHGKQPTSAEINEEPSRITGWTYSNRFGSWRKALEAFVDYANLGESEAFIEEKDDDKTYEVEISSSNEITHRTTRNINIRLRFLTFRNDSFKCKICGKSPATDSKITLHVDHIHPWSKGGETVLENLQTLCSKCNLGKSNL